MNKRRLKEIEKINITGLGFVPIKQDSASFTPEYVKREVQNGQLAEYDGYREKRESAKLSFTLNHLEGDSWQRRLNEVGDAEITIYYSDGSSVVMHEAYSDGVGESKSGEISGFSFMASTSSDM